MASDAAQDETNSLGPATHENIERLFKEHNESLLRFLRARLRSPQEAGTWHRRPMMSDSSGAAELIGCSSQHVRRGVARAIEYCLKAMH